MAECRVCGISVDTGIHEVSSCRAELSRLLQIERTGHVKCAHENADLRAQVRTHEAELAAMKRELHRVVHGEAIESDGVCSHELALAAARADVDRLREMLSKCVGGPLRGEGTLGALLLPALSEEVRARIRVEARECMTAARALLADTAPKADAAGPYDRPIADVTRQLAALRPGLPMRVSRNTDGTYYVDAWGATFDTPDTAPKEPTT